jgi:hypothetical protein
MNSPEMGMLYIQANLIIQAHKSVEESMPAQLNKLRIATKIHFFLLRELGQGIDIERMLSHELYARDVLLVCEACAGTELARLAAQFRSLQTPGVAEPAAPYITTQTAQSAPMAHMPRPLEWATSAKEARIPAPLLAQASEPQRGWLSRMLDR